jgi:glycosyltransferase involved in cell wall biosynthesis
MRILHVVQGYTPAIGGTERVIQEISEKLVEHHADQVTVYTTVGYNCEIFWRRDQPSLPVGTATINGVTVRRFPVFNRFNLLRRLLAGVTYKLRLPFNDYFRAFYNGPIIPTMTREIASADAELVAASSFPLLHMQYALRGARRADVPVVLIGGIHVADAWGFDSPLVFRTLRRADQAIAYTHFERDALIARGVPEEHISVIGLGVEPEAWAKADGTAIRQQYGWGNDPVVGYIGQQVAHKGIDTLIASMMRTWPDHPTVQLLIAGRRTSYTDVLERLVEQLPSEWHGRVTLVHNFDESIKPDLFAACDIFAHPSAYESFGLTLLEAWAAGRPVIACRDSAPGSIVEHEQDGLLVKYHDEADLAGALQTLLAAPGRRVQMGKTGQRKVLAEYTWDAVTDRFRDVYAQTYQRYRSQQHTDQAER